MTAIREPVQLVCSSPNPTIWDRLFGWWILKGKKFRFRLVAYYGKPPNPSLNPKVGNHLSTAEQKLIPHTLNASRVPRCWSHCTIDGRQVSWGDECEWENINAAAGTSAGFIRVTNPAGGKLLPGHYRAWWEMVTPAGVHLISNVLEKHVK